MRVISYLIIIFLAPALILLNFSILVFNYRFYQSEFAKLGVYRQFPKEIVDTQARDLIDYLCCQGALDQNFFTQKEKLHLADVKSLIRLVNLQFIFTAAVIIACCTALFISKKINLLLFGLRWGSTALLVSVISLWLAAIFNFDLFFTKFHLLSFKNDLWLLPPESNLIKLFPQAFFADFANRIAYQTIVFSISILITSMIINSILKKHIKI